MAGALLLLVAGFAAPSLYREVRFRRQLREAEQALARRAFGEAGGHLEACLEVRPGDLPTRLLAAQAARRRGDARAALRHLRFYERNGGSAEALELERRLLRVEQGDLTEARMMLAFCTEHPEAPETPLVLEALIEGLLPTLYQALVREGASQGHMESVDLTPAQRAVEQWLRLCPSEADQVQGLVWSGQVQSLTRDYPKARSIFRKALELDPDHFQARLYLAELLVREAPEEAAAHLHRLRQLAPDNNHVRLRLAAVLRGLGEVEEARRLLDEVLAADPDNAPALLARARVALDEGKPEAAEHWLRRAFARQPDHPEINLALATCLQQLGQIEKAKWHQEKFEQVQAKQKRQLDKLRRDNKSTDGG